MASSSETALNQKETPLRIAMFGQKRIPSREGGVEVVAEELAVRMVQKGHAVTCYNRKGHPVTGSEEDAGHPSEYRGVKLKEVFTVDRRGLAAITASGFAALHAAFGRFDVVHIHAEGPAFWCWLPKWFGKRVTVTVHGLDHQRAKWGKLASAFIKAGEKNAVRFADEIVVLSADMQEYFWKTYGRKTRLIPNGVKPAPVRPAETITEKWGLKKDGYLLYLGRIVPEKGEHYLIEAFQKVKTDKRLVIAGGSSDTEAYLRELQALAAKDDRVIFTGFVQGRIKHELYSNAYLYTLPSDLEGMPLSLLEAMSYGNCCVTSDIPECAEVVEDKAVLFAKGNVEDLQNTLQTLCDHPETVQNYRAEAGSFIRNKYRWEDVVEKTLALYRNEE